MSVLIDPQWFEALARPFLSKAKAGELISLSSQVDQCEFVRLNAAKVVQASQVDYISLGMGLRKGAKSVSAGLSLSTDLRQAREQLREQLERLRSWLTHVPDDPFMEQWAPPSQSHTDSMAPAAPAEQVVEELSASAKGLDLVGLYAAGPLASFMATSDGHFHWHRSLRSFFDFSVYAQKDKAIKGSWSGGAWSKNQVHELLSKARSQVEVLYRPEIHLSPGAYKTLLSAEAVADLFGLACWGGFSARAHLTGQSPLGGLQQGRYALSNLLSVEENLQSFGIPLVQGNGYQRSAQTPLIEQGRFANWLCSPRTAQEFGIDHNAAAGSETPEGLAIGRGDLASADEFDALETGIYLSNVWYLNFSDRQAGRFTGMSRFASLWVENGRPVGPIAPIRFDDSFSAVFGDKLLALGDARQRFDELSTYGARGLGGVQSPAALVQNLVFAL